MLSWLKPTPPLPPTGGPGPLPQAPTGQPQELVSVRASAELRRRLTDLGLTPGVPLMVLQNSGGTLIVAVRGARLALGRPVAQQLLVQPADEIA